MGDVVHNLPVVSDIASAVPGAQVDWIVEENFAPIPRLHPSVRDVIPVALRRWRKHPFDPVVRREWNEFRSRLRERRYDAVLDTQGLFKSAVLARMARGLRHGLDWRSSREPLRLFYDRTHAIPWSMHAVERNRLLTAEALGYRLHEGPRYGISAPSDSRSAVNAKAPTAVLLHSTSAVEKEWPEQRWIDLGRRLHVDRGWVSTLPYGSPREQERSRRLAESIPDAVVPPQLGIDALAGLLGEARVVVGVDTGLTHLAVALGRPTIGLYCATDPAATGLYGSESLRNLGGVGLCPATGEVLDAVRSIA